MKRLFALFLALILTAGIMTACGEEQATAEETIATEPPTEAETVVSDEMREAVAGMIEESLTGHDCKGAVYIVYRGEEVYSGGAGKANKAEDIDNSADVVYHIASNTKQFTAAAILKLCEEGKMTLDDTLSLYFPEYTVGAQITVHNLLSMQSGIPDYVREYDDNGYEITADSDILIAGVGEDNSFEENRAALRDWIFAQDLLFEQGERFSYCNSNYFLLGEIIEKVSGVSYFDYLGTNFFEPLGMETAGFMENYDNPGATVAVGYHRTGEFELLGYNGVAFGCGDMMASPKDLYKWTVALHGGRVLSGEMYQKMITEHCEGDNGYSSYGYGLMINHTATTPVYFHTGSIPCFLSCVMYAPQLDFYIAVMSNYASDSILSAASDISGEFLQKIGMIPGL